MIARIIQASLERWGVTLFFAVVLLGVGIWSAANLPIDAVPDITNVQVQVNTEVPALAPEEIEKLVTYPIEIEMAGIAGVTDLRSISKFGLSQVTMAFRDGTDIYRARQLVIERLANALDQLPPGVSPKLAPISSGLGEILHYTADYRADATNRPATRFDQLMELRDIQEYVIKPFLRSVPGVAEVNSAGGYERQILIQPRPEDLRNAGLTFGELADIISQNVENAGGGVINRGNDMVTIRTISRVENLEEIEMLPVKFAANVEPLRVKDLAEVGIGSNFRTGAALENGEEAVLGTVMMLAGENSRIVAHRVAGRIEAFQANLPPGVEMRVQYDRSELVDRTIHTVQKNLFEGAVLVVVVLLFMLGNWRAALIVAAAIPLSFLFAIAGMVQGRISGNLMSLGAVDFGLIIDGAVVMAENIVRQLGERQHKLGRPLNAEERRHMVLVAGRQVATPMFFGVLIIAIVYLPMLALSGIEGKMFRPMALTVMLALGGALALSVTLIPVLCSLLLRGNITEGDNAAVRFVKCLYRPTLIWALRLRWPVLLFSVALFAWSLQVFRHLGSEFVPTLDEGSYTAMVYQPASTSLRTSLDRAKASQRYLLEHVPEVTRTFARIGTSEVATDPMPPGEYDLYINYRDPGEWRKEEGKTISKERLAGIIAEGLGKTVENQTYFFAQPIEMRFNEMLEGIRSDISVKIFGEDYDAMEAVAERVKSVIEQVPGAAEVEFEKQGRAPMLEMQLDRAAMHRFNIQAAEVNRGVVTALAGGQVGRFIQGNRRYDIVVRMGESLRERTETMKAIPLRTRDGGLVTLGQVTTFRETENVDAVMRESGRRRVAIMVNLSGGDLEGWVSEAQKRVAREVTLPEGVQVEFGGQFENLRKARTRLAVVVPVALTLIFVLVFAAVGSVRQTILVSTGIPLAVTGGVLALWFRGMPFSISAGVGFIALSGVAVLNGLVLVNYFNWLRENGRSVHDAVVEGALTRLRPVLMTALVASFGFVPMALATSAGAEVQRPLATVVIGGILTSTFLTLVLLPSLYHWLEKDESPGVPPRPG